MTLCQASSLKSPCFVEAASQIKGVSREVALRWGARGVVLFLPGYRMWDPTDSSPLFWCGCEVYAQSFLLITNVPQPNQHDVMCI